jgi:hypothetical protein
MLESSEARQPGENSAIYHCHIARHDPAVDPTMSDG